MKLHLTTVDRMQSRSAHDVMVMLESGGCEHVAIHVGAFEHDPQRRFQAIVAREPRGANGELRWHISVSAQDRVPAWEELVEFAHRLRPGVPFVMGIPPRSWWMNVHPHTLHLWECMDEELLAEWRANRGAHAPT